ncbi:MULTISPECIES: cbb3-type cytochrome c oxidase subunit I [unclassified Mesorhizobium]|uniref:cbb3-type cytochrome c oxidase subunit I n=1 Tax=unclassified Mesorhizobium TaxID=325217 RepID=UPI00112A0013|nr:MULTISPECIES: cbb3-type cytochrome c oxidase subunit I [unclassified Mesorhizobium]MBZ9739636.1 cbb3-type cytochrome c oxidase subunit I [Mesorhizobium sp. CO1-1-4]MBZ9805101.1 cbb3-type cytochrome c oxidase subunit I [Mesorhizobium sp. ES1-6]TPL83581.1 cbb3-type cytochrome c oxidase subunit I [Mesorhizobium sp. B2-3-12]
MPKVSELFFKTAIVFLILGILAGLQMAISGDHGAFPAHAHINLLGWVTSAIFGGYYALNPVKAARRIAMIHYGLYTLGIVIMLPALYLMLQGGRTEFEPIVAGGSLIVAAAVLVFAVVVFSAQTVRSASGLSPAPR